MNKCHSQHTFSKQVRGGKPLRHPQPTAMFPSHPHTLPPQPMQTGLSVSPMLPANQIGPSFQPMGSQYPSMMSSSMMQPSMMYPSAMMNQPIGLQNYSTMNQPIGLQNYSTMNQPIGLQNYSTMNQPIGLQNYSTMNQPIGLQNYSTMNQPIGLQNGMMGPGTPNPIMSSLSPMMSSPMGYSPTSPVGAYGGLPHKPVSPVLPVTPVTPSDYRGSPLVTPAVSGSAYASSPLAAPQRRVLPPARPVQLIAPQNSLSSPGQSTISLVSSTSNQHLLQQQAPNNKLYLIQQQPSKVTPPNTVYVVRAPVSGQSEPVYVQQQQPKTVYVVPKGQSSEVTSTSTQSTVYLIRDSNGDLVPVAPEDVVTTETN